MRYLLDTNTCIYALNRADPALTERLRGLKRGQLAVSAVTVAELLFGAARSARPVENARRAAQFVAPLAELAFDRPAAEAYAAARAALAAKGHALGLADMLIAATGLAHGLTVVTNDRLAFARVPGLRVENWSRLDS